MILPEDVGKEISREKFNINVFSKTSKLSVIQRNGYSLYIYLDKAFLSFKNETGEETFIEFNKKDLTKIFCFKVDVLRGLINDMPKREDDHFRKKAFLELTQEVSELGAWFLEANGYWEAK